ncbi:MAG: GspH/FimT family pseudopilin [Halioglobus sp.]|nr:GspH/FimT family pseudopilin [Halioglobus sp.]
MVAFAMSTATSSSGIVPVRFTQRGFTLVELMIGLVLVSVLLGIGVPTFREFVLSQRAQATGMDINIALVTARSEAIKRNTTVVLAAHADGWGSGWVIPSPNPGEPEILNHVQSGNVSITGPDSPAEVEFSPSGRTMAMADFEIDTGPDSGNVCRFVRLGLDGRTSFEKGECTDE